MEVAVKPTRRHAEGATTEDGLAPFGRAVAGVQISEPTMDGLRNDSWTQFIESASSFCGEVSHLDREQPVIDEGTLRAWRETAERLTASLDSLYAIATGDKPYES